MKRSFLSSVLRGAEALAARDPAGTLPEKLSRPADLRAVGRLLAPGATARRPKAP